MAGPSARFRRFLTIGWRRCERCGFRELKPGSEDAAEPIKQRGRDESAEGFIAESSYADIREVVEWSSDSRALDGSVLKDAAGNEDEGPGLGAWR